MGCTEAMPKDLSPPQHEATPARRIMNALLPVRRACACLVAILAKIEERWTTISFAILSVNSVSKSTSEVSQNSLSVGEWAVHVNFVPRESRIADVMGRSVGLGRASRWLLYGVKLDCNQSVIMYWVLSDPVK